MDNWTLNISNNGFSSISLDKLFQHFIACILKITFYAHGLILSQGTTEKSLAQEDGRKYPYTWIRAPVPTLLQSERYQLFQSLLIQQMPQSINHLYGHLLIFIKVRDTCVSKLETSYDHIPGKFMPFYEENGTSLEPSEVAEDGFFALAW